MEGRNIERCFPLWHCGEESLRWTIWRCEARASPTNQPLGAEARTLWWAILMRRFGPKYLVRRPRLGKDLLEKRQGLLSRLGCWLPLRVGQRPPVCQPSSTPTANGLHLGEGRGYAPKGTVPDGRPRMPEDLSRCSGQMSRGVLARVGIALGLDERLAKCQDGGIGEIRWLPQLCLGCEVARIGLDGHQHPT